MPGIVYLLCAATSLTSGFLLWRAARGEGARLLFWSSLCFFGMALNNVLLYVDFHVFPDVNMYLAPQIAQLASLIVLCYGLIWEAT